MQEGNQVLPPDPGVDTLRPWTSAHNPKESLYPKKREILTGLGVEGLPGLPKGREEGDQIAFGDKKDVLVPDEGTILVGVVFGSGIELLH